MRKSTKKTLAGQPVVSLAGTKSYETVLGDIVGLLETARHASVRAVNTVMTATYWEIGRRIVEFEQGGISKAPYGEKLLLRLGNDLSGRFGRGFSKRNLEQMRQFYLCWPITQTLSAQLSGKEICQIVSGKLTGKEVIRNFSLPWSHYVRLLSVENKDARQFYEAEALRGGWSVRQLDRQISAKFFERTLLSKNKAAMLKKGETALAEDRVSPEEEIKDPFVLEFLGLKDEYSETELEEALVGQLETFLLELGGDFAFVGRQRRLRVGNEWYRVDLVFFHRVLRCLVIIDLKVGKFTHADAGQMHLYLNYAREHWTNAGENPPVGLILCAEKDAAVAHYALEGLSNKVLAAEYRMRLPEEKVLIEELNRTRKRLLLHDISRGGKRPGRPDGKKGF